MMKTFENITARSLAVRIFILTLIISASLLIYVNTKGILSGPQIIIETPQQNNNVVIISGSARNTSFLYLNGRQIFTDETGRFQEKMLLARGYTIMKVEAKDRFGKKKMVLIPLTYYP